MRTLSAEDKSRILSRLFDEQVRTGRPVVAAAMRILSDARRASVFNPDEAQMLAAISGRMSQGGNLVLSEAYLEASVSHTPAQTSDRAAALCNMYTHGSPHPGLSIFGSKWDS